MSQFNIFSLWILSMAMMGEWQLLMPGTAAFLIRPQCHTARRVALFPHFAAAQSSAMPEISAMRVGEIKKELESYGISTKIFLEKSEMVEALEKARAEDMHPITKEEEKPEAQDTSTQKSTTKASSASASKSKNTTKEHSSANSGTNGADSDEETPSRNERIQMEMEKAKTMKIGDLRQELKRRGIRTTSFFEKSEFVRAYAEAIVDGTGTTGQKATQQDEPYDPAYRDVVMSKMGPQDLQRLALEGGSVIEITLG